MIKEIIEFFLFSCWREVTCIFLISKDNYVASILLDYAVVDAPGGFLFEWWSVFWDIFIARTNVEHSKVAAPYIEVAFRNLYFGF